MTNDTSNHGTSSLESADDELAQLLCDAYDAPPLPNSLLQRLEHELTREWGTSPGLVVSRMAPLKRVATTGLRWFRKAKLPLIALLVVATVLLSSRWTPAYAWASFADALGRQDVVQLDRPGLTRWLSVSAKVIGERWGDNISWLDLQDNFRLERTSDETRVRRQQIGNRAVSVDRDRLILTFLLGDTGSDSPADRFQGARIVGQSWKHVEIEKQKQVSLKVRWETKQAEHFEIHLTLDPVTSLPVACDIRTDDQSDSIPFALSYPAESLAQTRAIAFPPDYAVVDVDRRGDPNSRTVARADSASEQRDLDRSGNATTSNFEPIGNPPGQKIEFSPIGGPTPDWKPVVVSAQPRDDVVEELDRLLSELWQSNQVDPAPPADDEELLRRIYLDLAGRTPSVYEIRAYLADKSPQRYGRLVDRLLDSRDYASHLATVWRTFLIPEGIDLTAFGGVETFDRWLAGRFGNNDTYASIVHDLLLAEGRLSRSGPLLFYSAVKLDADQLAARTSRVFLGLRLECAQCHDHPFEPWKQEDFWGMAAFFARISRPRGELQAVSTVMQVRDVDHGEVKMPQQNSVIPPKFLNASEAIVDQPDNLTSETRRQQLSRWVTSAENPYFSRATVNRVWAIMFGKGLVDPVDDFGVRHPPKSSQVMELLAGHFIHSDFDLKDLFRIVARSHAYALSSGAPTADPKRQEYFAQMNVKMLTAEQVYDCMTIATLLDSTRTADPFAFNVVRYDNLDRESFLKQFRTPSGRSSEYLGGIPQALTLMNGALIENATGVAQSGLLKSLDAPFFTNQQRVEVLYLATLSRHPRPAEWELLKSYISSTSTSVEVRENLSDILWALLNSAEFTMNH